MSLPDKDCYRALLARDRRFDGLFYVAVKTTGIYCRPICPVKPPAQAHCRFFRHAALCESAGFRPCLRCRPELAPGSTHAPAPVDAIEGLANRAMALIAASPHDLDTSSLAQTLQITDRHLRRVFAQVTGTSPSQYIATRRLLAAKQLLAETALTLEQIASATGFGSARRLRAQLSTRYKLKPKEMRGRSYKVGDDAIDRDSFSFKLGYRPPFDWPSMLDFLASRACPGVEFVERGRYSRTVSMNGHTGWLEVTNDEPGNCLVATLSVSLLPCMMQVKEALSRLFDVEARPDLINARLGELARAHPGLRLPGAFDSFEMAVRAVLGQQVSVKAATSLSGRLSAAFGTAIGPYASGLSTLSPTAEVLARASATDISALGILPTRARTLIALARAYCLDPRLASSDYKSFTGALLEIEGIGEWTADYIAMRTLRYPDVFLHGDLGVKKALALEGKKALLARAEPYRPWRSYAVMHLWKSLTTDI